MNPHLGKQKPVPFQQLYLDPNNPRLGTAKPGYDDPKKIFDPTCQTEIENTIKAVYEKIDALKSAILHQGWTPIDAMLVWEHPQAMGQFIVVEGNTRLTTLRLIRSELAKSTKQLERLKKAKAQRDLIEEMEREIARLQQIVDETDQLDVVPVTVSSAEALLKALPRILSVRHIAHPRQWGPYAQSLYILEQYEELFRAKHPGAKELELDETLVDQVASMFSQRATETRKNIQSAAAFRRFRQKYGAEVEALGKNQGLKDEDHYFFQQILENKYARQQFKFGDEDLRLASELEDVLFKWAFSKPRKGTDNPNVLYKAENFREWHRMAKDMPELASQLDVSKPDEAPPFHELESAHHASKAQRRPAQVLEKLVQSLRELPAETLVSEASHLKPLLEETIKICREYISMIEAVEKGA